MPTEKLEIDIIAKGKPAEKAIENVDKKTQNLEKSTKKAGSTSDSMLSRLKAGWVAVGATVALAVNEAVQFERVAVGLSDEMRKFAKETALSSQATAEQVAGFLKSAQTAGLADEQMKKLAKDAIALGYAFPHEDAETLHDNLVMLNTTGEAQGFVVDILEQQYAKMGRRFQDIDLKAVSTEEKLRLVNNVIRDSQNAMDESVLRDYDEMMGTLDNSATDVGQTLIKLGSDTGAFALVSGVIKAGTTIIQGFAVGIERVIAGAKDLLGITAELNRVAEIEAKVKADREKQKSVEEQLVELTKMKLEIEKELNANILEGVAKQSAEEQLNVITKQIKSLEEYGNRHEILRQEIQATKDAEVSWYDEAKNKAEDYFEGASKGVTKYIDEVKSGDKQLDKLGSIGYKVATSIEDAFVNMAMGTKSTFKDMANAVIAELIRIQVRQSVVTPLLKAFGFSGSSVTPTTSHTGGIIGLPSYHAGMRSDERLAKLQVGEAVVNRAGVARNKNAIDAMNAGYQVGGTGNVTQAEINFNVTAIDANSFNNYLVGNKHTIENIINNSLQTNGTVRQTIKQVI